MNTIAGRQGSILAMFSMRKVINEHSTEITVWDAFTHSGNMKYAPVPVEYSSYSYFNFSLRLPVGLLVTV